MRSDDDCHTSCTTDDVPAVRGIWRSNGAAGTTGFSSKIPAHVRNAAPAGGPAVPVMHRTQETVGSPFTLKCINPLGGNRQPGKRRSPSSSSNHGLSSARAALDNTRDAECSSRDSSAEEQEHSHGILTSYVKQILEDTVGNEEEGSDDSNVEAIDAVKTNYKLHIIEEIALDFVQQSK